jgi:hypothetical protein
MTFRILGLKSRGGIDSADVEFESQSPQEHKQSEQGRPVVDPGSVPFLSCSIL